MGRSDSVLISSLGIKRPFCPRALLAVKKNMSSGAQLIDGEDGE